MRSQLTLLATSLVAAMLVASAFGLVAAQERALTHGIDEALVQRADNIQQDVVRGAFGSRLPVEGDPEDSFLQLLAPDGTVVAASDNAAQLPPATAPLPGEVAEAVRTVDAFGLSDGRFRVLARSVRTDAGPRTLVVGKNLDDVAESVGTLVRSLVVAIPVVTVLLAVLVWWLTGRALRPVELLRAEVASIRGDDLHRRVPTPRSGDEIARLADTMNEMLERAERATRRQQQFVADASHELRGPLTRLRSTLEVELAHRTGDGDPLLPGLLADTTRLQQLVDDLLFLARSDADAHAVRREPVDLDDLVLDEARRLRGRGAVEVEAGAVGAARTLGDPRELGRVIANLAANAERHARSRVTFEVRERGQLSEVVVADDGEGIPQQHRETVFDRFTRLDAARSAEAGGAGLGLAIVRDIVTRHGGTVSVAAANGGGARFVVSLPRAE